MEYDDYTLQELSLARASLQDQHRDALEKAESIAERLELVDEEFDKRLSLFNINIKGENKC
jgi:hypothetical protein